MTRIFAKALAAGVATWALACSTTALAQTSNATQPSPTTPADVDDVSVQDIVVTAQRRQERLQDVPISVAAVDASLLEKRGVATTSELAAAIPGLTILTTAGFVQPRIRGIGNNIVGAGYEGGVATYIDGVYLASAPATFFSLSNIERIEVLKGPQGTLFGRNTTGGLIQIVTKRPSHRTSGSGSLTYGNYDYLAADGYFTTGLGQDAAIDFAGHVSTQRKGFGTNLTTGQRVGYLDLDLNLRSSLLVTPAPGTEIRVTADYANSRGATASVTRLAPGTGTPLPFVDPGYTWNAAEDIQPFNNVKTGGVAIDVSQQIGFAQIKSITAYRETQFQVVFDGDVTSTPFIGLDVKTSDHQFSEEFQLAALPGSRIQWVAGVFYFQALARYNPSRVNLFGGARPNTPVGPIGGIDTFASLPNESVAGYAQATIPLFGDATRLTLGGRYTTEKREISAYTFTDFASGLRAPGAPIPNQSTRVSKPTWRASLDHRFSPEVLTYASYNRGFKSGGYNGQFPTDPAFRPETIDAYEIGAKTDLLNRRLRLNAAGFYMDYKDIQVSRYVGSQVSYYNGAAARVFGVDADFVARVARRFTLSGGITYIDSKFTDFPNAIISRQVPTGLVVTVGSAKGNRLPLTARLSSTLTADYAVPIGSAKLDLSGSWTHNSGYFAQPDNILRQPEFNLFSASALVTLQNGLSLRVWGRNLSQERVFQTLQAGTFDSNASYQPPRTYGGTVGFKF